LITKYKLKIDSSEKLIAELNIKIHNISAQIDIENKKKIELSEKITEINLKIEAQNTVKG